MKSFVSKLALGSVICLATQQGLAQNVTAKAEGQSASGAASAMSQTEMGTIRSLKNIFANQIKPWEKPDPRNPAKPDLKSVYDRTFNYLKSPRPQRMSGGSDMGGGGNSLICEENGKHEAKLLDIFEAEELGIEIDFGPGKSFQEKIDYTLDRLAKISPIRAQVYREMAYRLLTRDTQWVQNSRMPVIDDVKLTTFPQGCLLVQTAVQRPIEQENLPNAKTYIIDRDMFNLLDEESKAGLVLHEVLYREARYSKVNNSDFTRDLVGLIASPNILRYNLAKLNELYEKNRVTCLESPFLKSHFALKANSSCNFRKEIKSYFKGTIQTPEVMGLDATLLINGRMSPITTSVESKGFGFNINGTTQIYNKVYSNESKDNWVIRTPTLKVNEGSIVFAKSEYDVKASEFLDYISNILKGWDETKGWYSQWYKPSIQVIGDSIQGQSSLLKINLKNDDYIVKAAVIIEDNCLSRGMGDGAIEAYIGDRGIKTNNGWIEVGKVCFKDDKIVAAYAKDLAKIFEDDNYTPQ